MNNTGIINYSYSHKGITGDRYVMNLTLITEWLFCGPIKISLWMLYEIRGWCISINCYKELFHKGWGHIAEVQYK